MESSEKTRVERTTKISAALHDLFAEPDGPCHVSVCPYLAKFLDRGKMDEIPVMSAKLRAWNEKQKVYVAKYGVGGSAPCENDSFRGLNWKLVPASGKIICNCGFPYVFTSSKPDTAEKYIKCANSTCAQEAKCRT